MDLPSILITRPHQAYGTSQTTQTPQTAAGDENRWVGGFTVYAGPTWHELQHIAYNMRKEDVAECEAWGLTPFQAAENFHQAEYTWVVYAGTYPVFVVGLKQHLPDAYYLIGFGSDQLTKRTMRQTTKWGMKTWLYEVFYVFNARRLDVLIPFQSAHSFNWLTALGMRVVGWERDFIKRGDRFHRLSYTISDFESVH